MLAPHSAPHTMRCCITTETLYIPCWLPFPPQGYTDRQNQSFRSTNFFTQKLTILPPQAFTTRLYSTLLDLVFVLTYTYIQKTGMPACTHARTTVCVRACVLGAVVLLKIGPVLTQKMSPHAPQNFTYIHKEPSCTDPTSTQQNRCSKKYARLHYSWLALFWNKFVPT